MIKNKWLKLPSVSRENKYFYYSDNRAILQSWTTNKWFLSENGRNSKEEFDSPKKAMKWAETNVVH